MVGLPPPVRPDRKIRRTCRRKAYGTDSNFHVGRPSQAVLFVSGLNTSASASEGQRRTSFPRFPSLALSWVNTAPTSSRCRPTCLASSVRMRVRRVRDLTTPPPVRQTRSAHVVHFLGLFRPAGGDDVPGRWPQRLDGASPGSLIVGIDQRRSPAAGLHPLPRFRIGNGAKRARVNPKFAASCPAPVMVGRLS